MKQNTGTTVDTRGGGIAVSSLTRPQRSMQGAAALPCLDKTRPQRSMQGAAALPCLDSRSTNRRIDEENGSRFMRSLPSPTTKWMHRRAAPALIHETEEK